jgi:hypothetical protein
MISFIWSLRKQRLGTTVKYESFFTCGSIGLAVTTGLLSTLDGNRISVTPRSLDHRGKKPPPPLFSTRWKRMIFGLHNRSGRREKFSVIIRNVKVTFWSSCWQDFLYAEGTAAFIIFSIKVKKKRKENMLVFRMPHRVRVTSHKRCQSTECQDWSFP